MTRHHVLTFVHACKIISAEGEKIEEEEGRGEYFCKEFYLTLSPALVY